MDFIVWLCNINRNNLNPALDIEAMKNCISYLKH